MAFREARGTVVAFPLCLADPVGGAVILVMLKAWRCSSLRRGAPLGGGSRLVIEIGFEVHAYVPGVSPPPPRPRPITIRRYPALSALTLPDAIRL